MSIYNLSESQQYISLLKFKILAEGLNIGNSARKAYIQAGKKQPLRTRSGVSGGLDLYLGEDVYVNAPTEEAFAQKSSLKLSWDLSTGYFIETFGEQIVVDILEEPDYYSLKGPVSGQPLRYIGQMCSGDRFCYGMTGPTCVFWGRKNRCQYCTIGAIYNPDLAKKHEEEFITALEYALKDEALPAKHVLLGGGTPVGDDMGAKLASKLTKQIKNKWPDLSVYAMIAAPKDNCYLDELIDSGVDEIGLNLEFWSEYAWMKYIPGKNTQIGRQRYLDTLSYCADKIGAVRTRSIVIAGIESEKHTLRAVQELVDRNVMPIISPFRPLPDSQLQKQKLFSFQQYVDLYQECKEVCDTAGIPLGPTCIHCQNNILALPFGEEYRYY